MSWALADLLKDWVQVQTADTNIMISGLSLDSRFAQPGDLFFATHGTQKHGIEFSNDAITKGAVAIAWELNQDIDSKNLPTSIPCLSIPDLQQQIGWIAQRFYYHPSEYINVIGVTGTDGKTSVSQFIAQAFHHLGTPCGVIGTLGYGVYPKLQSATHTTPDAIRTQSLLYSFNKQDVNNAVIEASSHGLKQGRLNGVDFNIAVFTNLSRDHLDYHATLEDYANAKRILFQMPNLQHAIINIDDEFGCQLAGELAEKINLVTYSSNNCQQDFGSFICVKNVNFSDRKTNIEIASSWGDAAIATELYGKFNISNLLAALAVLLVDGYPFENAVKAIANVHTVPGRMERVTSNNHAPTVIIDYAHTPQALSNVLQVLREQCNGKLWCVFGCGGDRDPGKRKLMAHAVERYADCAIVTDDNPRTEDPNLITGDIISGFSNSAKYTLIHDRQEAIAHVINHATCKDTVLIAGKGHETYQIINNEYFPFDDKKIAQIFLNDGI